MPEQLQQPTREVCRNCGRVLTGPWCSACGQPERDGHPPTLVHFFHDLVHEFLHVDGKIFLTLKTLFFHPGKLTEEYWAGRVYSWIRPIRIFLVTLALQALVSSGLGPLNHQVRVERTISGDFFVNIANDVREFEEKAEHITASDEELLEFSRKFEKAWNMVRYSSVLAFALVEWLIYRRRQPFFTSHLVAGLHFYSFWYVVALLASLPARLNPVWNNLKALSFIYLFLSLRRLFHERWYRTLAKTAALCFFIYSAEFTLGYAVAKWIER